MDNKQRNQSLKPWQRFIHEIIFEAETRSGKLFDELLIICILLSVGVVMLDSIESVCQIAVWVFILYIGMGFHGSFYTGVYIEITQCW